MRTLWSLLALLLVGCHHTHPAKDRPDVVVIVLDTLRADHLTQYGYSQQTSPGLAKFAAAATRFDEAYSPAPWTVPSTATIVSGVLPKHHHMRHPGDKLPATIDTLAERMKGAGWRTAAFSHNINVSHKLGFDQGFDDFATFKGEVLAYPHIAEMTEDVGDWVDDHGDDPFLLYLQPMNCHGPYKVPSDHKKTLLGRGPNPQFKYNRGLMKSILEKGKLQLRSKVTKTYLRSLTEKYDTAVRYELDEVGALFDQLEHEGLYDNALIVLTADHGEELYDHGGFSHGFSLHREVLHVPLFVKLPGQKQGGVVPDRVSLADVLPTILDAAKVPVTGTLDGRSLMPLLHGETLPAQPLLFEADWKRRCVAKALLDGPWKLLSIAQNYEGLQDVVQLYDTTNDPNELHDLAAEQPERVTALRAELDALATDSSGAPAPENLLESMDKKQLEALGYLE
jgi:arylsulfatase A-like enzyme